MGEGGALLGEGPGLWIEPSGSEAWLSPSVLGMPKWRLKLPSVFSTPNPQLRPRCTRIPPMAHRRGNWGERLTSSFKPTRV